MFVGNSLLMTNQSWQELSSFIEGTHNYSGELMALNDSGEFDLIESVSEDVVSEFYRIQLADNSVLRATSNQGIYVMRRGVEILTSVYKVRCTDRLIKVINGEKSLVGITTIWLWSLIDPQAVYGLSTKGHRFIVDGYLVAG